MAFLSERFDRAAEEHSDRVALVDEVGQTTCASTVDRQFSCAAVGKELRISFYASVPNLLFKLGIQDDSGFVSTH